MIGELQMHHEGYGFVVSAKLGEQDVFIPARHIGDALHGDMVEVETRPGRKGLLEGEIKHVKKRFLKQLIGKLEWQGKAPVVIAEDKRVRRQVSVKLPKYLKIASNDWVLVEITAYPEGAAPMRGEVVKKLPKRGTLQTELEFIVGKYQLFSKFDKEVIDAADRCREISSEIEPGRKDLKSLPFITIDGADAKDFDDAVLAKKEKGRTRVWIAIADVSHFVEEGSCLDQSALERGTSVYFPGKVLPMFPEAISNELCSLRPNEEKFVLIAELLFNNSGQVIEENFYPGMIQSHHRFTYEQVENILKPEGSNASSLRANAKQSSKEDANILNSLSALSQTAQALKQRRAKSGALDFDLPEPEIVLSLQGGIDNIEKSNRLWAHQVIEELMVAANEAVARKLTKDLGFSIYRIHEDPKVDRLKKLFKLVNRLGFRGRLHLPVSPPDLAKILDHFKGSSEVKLVNTFLVRSLAQAVYSTQNVGHFGLASSCYTHFTSPIRRYPDLIVHRLIKKIWKKEKLADAKKKEISMIAEQNSLMERRAVSAERESIKLHNAFFMQQHLGEEFIGHISHVTKFGAFVELDEFFVEGVVPVELMSDDYYQFNEESLSLKGKRHKKTYTIGDRVKIRCERVDIEERKVEFVFIYSV